jgi:endonuclease G, mitochondrial
MKFKLLVAALFVATGFAYAADQVPPHPIAQCAAQIPYGQPTIKAGDTLVCRAAYLLAFNSNTKTPDWVSWTLTPDHAIGCVVRTNAFAADQSLPASAKPQDYAGSGYDQGHLANDADMSWDNQVEHESFYMSNMSPQLPSVNRGTWKNLESAVRAWVYSTKHAHTIYAGNIGGTKTIGASKVIVPDFLFKIVTDDVTKKSYAFLFPHKDGDDSDYTKYQVTVADVEKATGLTFPVPDSKTAKNPVPTTDLKTIAADKKAQCKS